MKSLKYFHINNIKFNYVLEFQSNHKDDYWKHNAPLIEYCETVGVNIPHYCYHKSLSISGNCRMCLVELKNSPKPIVSCAMSAKSCLNNSEIFTESPLVKKARENVLEFLLLNHPLDCPICDQGGECDLQDQSLFFGISKKRFYNYKRVVTDKNIGPIVKTVMTRCIHCTRCVRFANEIAGTEDLGMFGRGLDSEIGTYVTKTFQSELSGNIIDLCPVGALTSKPYPFISRNWELKNVSSIDFSDGFLTNIQVHIKNNNVVKITSHYDSQTNTTNWISDKTRFAFDGMFSPARAFKGFIHFGTNNTITSDTWKTLLSEIISTLYFQDHLCKHFLNTKNMYLIFDSNTSIEIVNLLNLISKKYSFIKLRKSENGLKDNDFEKYFTITEHKTITKQLDNSSLCLLVGLNSRYESSSLNTKLRKRYMKGEFNVFSIGALINLTFPTSHLGFNVSHLKSIAEGNNFFCQKLVSTKSLLITSSNMFQRKDAQSLLKTLELINKNLQKYNLKNNYLHVVGSSVNETGVYYLNQFKPFCENDLLSSNGLYFLNTASQTTNLKKIINLKLLNQLNCLDSYPKYCFEQNNGFFSSNFVTKSKSSFLIYNYINLPNNVFFESNGTFLSTEGIFKKNIKCISTDKQAKDDWQILRKILTCTKKIKFSTNYKDNILINFNNNKINKFKNFVGFLSIASNNITLKSNSYLLNSIAKRKIEPNDVLRKKKVKMFTTKLKIWINDFFIGGKDQYSKQSSTMIICSKNFRVNNHTFNHLM
jgi:NADH-quinone oxidoreductase chain G